MPTNMINTATVRAKDEDLDSSQAVECINQSSEKINKFLSSVKKSDSNLLFSAVRIYLKIKGHLKQIKFTQQQRFVRYNGN